MGEFAFDLGVTARDTITGFKGVVASKTKWMNGCIRYGLLSKALKDGKPVEEQWFDEQRLKLVGAAIEPAAQKPGPGGPQNDPVLPSGPHL